MRNLRNLQMPVASSESQMKFGQDQGECHVQRSQTVSHRIHKQHMRLTCRGSPIVKPHLARSGTMRSCICMGIWPAVHLWACSAELSTSPSSSAAAPSSAAPPAVASCSAALARRSSAFSAMSDAFSASDARTVVWSTVFFAFAACSDAQHGARQSLSLTVAQLTLCVLCRQACAKRLCCPHGHLVNHLYCMGSLQKDSLKISFAAPAVYRGSPGNSISRTETSGLCAACVRLQLRRLCFKTMLTAL